MSMLLWKLGAVVVIGALLFGGGYYKGRQVGRVEALEASVKAYQKREEIDQNVNSKDDYAVCVALGGLPDECDELRRVEAPAKTE